MNYGIREVEEMAHRYVYVFEDFEEGETVYFHLIIAHSELLRLLRDGRLPFGLRELLLDVTRVLENFLSQSALSQLDLRAIRDSFRRILNWSETDCSFESSHGEPEMQDRETIYYIYGVRTKE